MTPNELPTLEFTHFTAAISIRRIHYAGNIVISMAVPEEGRGGE